MLIHHVLEESQPLFGGRIPAPLVLLGASGVDLFFVISGFIMYYTNQDRFGRAGAPGGVDPFSAKLDGRGRLTHGRLRENRNHGGKRGGLEDPRAMPGVAHTSSDPLAITDFLYGQGDLLRGGDASRPPEVAPGQS